MNVEDLGDGQWLVSGDAGPYIVSVPQLVAESQRLTTELLTRAGDHVAIAELIEAELRAMGTGCAAVTLVQVVQYLLGTVDALMLAGPGASRPPDRSGGGDGQ